ncbi:MAG: GMC family oxidoreductase [Steroidobacteraceae bacterium]
MLLDLTELPSDQNLQADVCIIGAGAAGITLALELMGSGLEVLLLEAGGLAEEAATQAFYEGTVANEALHSPPLRYRQRRFGGTTTIWGGRCMPLDDIDFEARDFVPHSGWPLGPEELAPYYRLANRLCEAGEFCYRFADTFPPPQREMIAGFRGVSFDSDRLERFSCPTDFGRRYGERLRAAANVRVVLHANVTRLSLDAGSARVVAASVRTLAGPELTVRAERFIVATGGLEVPRLLLNSNDVQHEGLGNQNDVLGRYYMCHIAGTIGELRFNGPLDSVWNGYDVSDEGIYCRRRLSLREDVQRRERVGNFVARLHHPRITNPEHRNAILSALFLAKFLIPYEYGKRLHGEENASLATWLSHLRNVALGPFDAAAFAWHMLRDRKLAERKFPSIIIKPKANLYSLDFHAEQEPNPVSRITLDAARDGFGLRRLRVDWRYTQGDVHTVQRALQLLATDIAAGGVGRFDYDPASVEFEMTRYGAYGGHHIGTARMGRDPRHSVVDADCRVHGIANLYVAGAAVFPTSSQANPTLTIVALAARLAHHLRACHGVSQ